MFSIGDKVQIKPDYARGETTVYTIVKINPKSIDMEPAGGGRRSRIQPWAIQPASEEAASKAQAVPYMPMLWMGQVVKVTIPDGVRSKFADAGKLHIILKDNGDGTCRIVRLGGDQGRYWSKIPRAWLTLVERYTITEA